MCRGTKLRASVDGAFLLVGMEGIPEVVIPTATTDLRL
jgi:hypothetical protein